MYPRKPPLPSFWRSAQWNEWLPPPSQDAQHDGLPSLPEFTEARKAIAALDPHQVDAPPVSLSLARRAASSLDQWFDQVGETLTWPPTVDGFVQAAKPLLAPSASDQDKFVLGLLDAMRPDLIAALRLEVDLRQSWMSGASQAPSHGSAGSNADGMSPMASEISSWLSSLRSHKDPPLTLLHEELDGKIKNSIMTTKGAGIRSKNYWFEDLFWPALCELSLEDLTDIRKFWPPHQECTFNDPAKAMDSRAFWQGLRNMPHPARRYLMDKLLPVIVNGQDWTPSQRLEMLDPMLSRVKEHPGIVRERLELWKAWGGDLDMVVDLPMEEGALSAPTTTASEWMKENQIDPDAPSAPRPRRNRGPK